MSTYKGLCFRCEHRARFYETGARPRSECGNTDSAVSGCYMYTPVLPIVQKRRKDDSRPASGNIFGSRCDGVQISQGHLMHIQYDMDHSFIKYWIPYRDDMIHEGNTCPVCNEGKIETTITKTFPGDSGIRIYQCVYCDSTFTHQNPEVTDDEETTS